MSDQKHKYRAGDIVQLRSGGPAMTADVSSSPSEGAKARSTQVRLLDAQFAAHDLAPPSSFRAQHNAADARYDRSVAMN